MIFTQEKTPQQTFICRVNNDNTRERGEKCSKLTIMSLQRRSTVFIVNFEYISYLLIPFSSVSTVSWTVIRNSRSSKHFFLVSYCV